MERILIISSTNRPDSNTLKVCHIYKKILLSLGVESEIFDFRELPETITVSELHGKRSDKFSEQIKKNISDFSSFLFVIPEYNGSFPGILKVFIDAVHPREWMDKRACITGISNGRAGNLRGMEHLTGILNYLKINVYHNKLPISNVENLIGENHSFKTEDQNKACKAQAEGFLKFIKMGS